jgi:amino acid transporter
MIILSLTMGCVSLYCIARSASLIRPRLCVNSTDLAAINDSAIGQPLAYIYDQAFGKHGSLAIWSFMCVGTFFMTASLAMPASRQAFAFARDGALPFSKYLYHVNKKTQTPVRSKYSCLEM